MRENRLAVLCALSAVLGIVLVFSLSNSAVPQDRALDGISAADSGRLVSVSATVASAYSRNGNWYFKLCRGECVTGFVPASAAAGMADSVDLGSIGKGAWVVFAGRVQVYNGQLEIVAIGERPIEVLGS